MKVKTVLSVVFMLLLSACSSKEKKSAKEFSDEVVRLEESLQVPIINAEAEIKQFADSANYKGVVKTAEKMEQLVQTKLDSINRVDVSGYSGGEDFKTVVERYFGYVKSLYSAYKNIGEAPDDNARLKESQEMNKLLAVQQEVLLNLKDAQVKFAAQNGFPLEVPEVKTPAKDTLTR